MVKHVGAGDMNIPALRTDAELREDFERAYAAADNTHRVMVLGRGARYLRPSREHIEAELINGHRDLYVQGYIDVEEFERRVEAVLTAPGLDDGMATVSELR